MTMSAEEYTIAGLRQQKVLMETAIRNAIARFVDATSVPVSSIEVDMVDVSSHIEKRFEVGRVSVEIQI